MVDSVWDSHKTSLSFFLQGYVLTQAPNPFIKRVADSALTALSNMLSYEANIIIFKRDELQLHVVWVDESALILYRKRAPIRARRNNVFRSPSVD